MPRRAQLRLDLKGFLIPVLAISTNEIIEKVPGAWSQPGQQVSIGKAHWRRRGVIARSSPTVDNVQRSPRYISSVSAAMNAPGMKKTCVARFKGYLFTTRHMRTARLGAFANIQFVG